MTRLYRLLIFVLLQVVCFGGKSQITALPVILSETLIAESDSAYFDDRSPVVIADIQITGYEKTRVYIIEREIPFKVGDYIPRHDLAARLQLCKEQLMNTALFVEVEVSVINQVNELAFIHIAVKERWYIFPLPYFKIVDRNFNQWWVEHNRSLDRVNYGIKFMHNNFSGRNDELNVWLINGYSQQASFRYIQPFADKSLKYGFDLGFSLSRNKEVSYDTRDNKQLFFKYDRFFIRSLHADVAVTYRPRIKTRHRLRLGYTDTRVNDTIHNLNPEFFGTYISRINFPDIAYSIEHYNVDYIPYPSRGVTVMASLLKRGFTGNMNLWQLSATSSYTIPVFDKSQIHLQATGMLKLPFDQPFFNKRLFGYGDLYMRGLEYYVADGLAGIVGRATARREILNFNVKSPFSFQGVDKVPFRILLKTYGDLGYAYDKNPSAFNPLNNTLLKSWGFGMDIISFYDLVLRLEYSFNQLNERGLYIHTGIDF